MSTFHTLTGLQQQGLLGYRVPENTRSQLAARGLVVPDDTPGLQRCTPTSWGQIVLDAYFNPIPEQMSLPGFSEQETA